MGKAIGAMLTLVVLTAGAFALRGATVENNMQRIGYLESSAANHPRFNTVGYDDTFNIVNASTTVKRGGKGRITLKGDSGESFTIQITYIRGVDMITDKRTVTADEKGITVFFYHVSKDSVPGTYPIIITGNNNSVRLIHTVL